MSLFDKFIWSVLLNCLFSVIYNPVYAKVLILCPKKAAKLHKNGYISVLAFSKVYLIFLLFSSQQSRFFFQIYDLGL